jgi:Xaa-Pro aminopeptidase
MAGKSVKRVPTAALQEYSAVPITDRAEIAELEARLKGNQSGGQPVKMGAVGGTFELASVQKAIRDLGLDGWLLYDFRGLNILARRVIGLTDEAMLSRRWFYFVPAGGEPRKLVHVIEPHALDSLPGSARTYLRWQELETEVGNLVTGARRVAMEYVPRNANPYVSRVDAGTVELVRSFGVDVVPSGDLVQLFEACWDDEQWAMHQEAARHTRSAFDLAFGFIAERVRQTGSVRETEVQQRILEHFAEHQMVTDHPPICAVGPHSGDPHYSPGPDSDAVIREGDFVLIDLWAKLDRPRSVYSDLTWTGYVGRSVPAKFEEIFQIVARARDAAIGCVQAAFREKRPLQGWQVDQAARDVIEQAGYGKYFCHRTGHSIGQETHGNGANMDNLETREERRVLPRTCFSVEPGIYLPEFGVRSEVNVFVDGQENVHVTGGHPQRHVLPLLRNITTV